MITGTLNIDNTVASLEAINGRIEERATVAVLATAKLLVERIIAYTVAPAPPPPVRYYARTGRFASGWNPAARLLGLSGPSASSQAAGSDEGSGKLITSADRVIFRAINNVPYAAAVEESGTWATPYPSRRKVPPYRGYAIVARASQETAPDFIKNVSTILSGE